MLGLFSIAAILSVIAFRMFSRYEKRKIVTFLVVSFTLPIAYLFAMITSVEFAALLGVLVTAAMIFEIFAYLLVPIIRNFMKTNESS